SEFAGAALERTFLIEDAGSGCPGCSRAVLPSFGRAAYEQWRGEPKRAAALTESLYLALPRGPMWARAALDLAAARAGAGAARAGAKLLVPMDDAQTDHLKAYGLTYWVLAHGQTAEWLLNYRGGSFLLADDPATEREANLRGVALEPLGGAAEATMRAQIADNNMEAVRLEKAPRVAVYIPPNTPPWDDAVTLALKYADIPYATVRDEEGLRG